jgi:hypothetical protein
MAQEESNGKQFATPARVKSTKEWGGAPQGVLGLDGRRIVFVVPPDRVKLDSTIDECEFQFSKWMMGQGFVIKTPEKKYSVGFAKITPFVAGTVLRDAGFEALGAAAAISGWASVINATQLTKQWKEVLSEVGGL